MPEPYRSRHASYIQRYLSTGKRTVLGIARAVPALHKTGAVFAVLLHLTRSTTSSLTTTVPSDDGDYFIARMDDERDVEAVCNISLDGTILACTHTFAMLFAEPVETLKQQNISKVPLCCRNMLRENRSYRLWIQY